MITKIVMSDCASYKNPTSLETDKKINLIYGLNGTGKSTFSNFFYAPQNPSYASCLAEGSGDAEVLVYNTAFVRDHFHEADKLNGIFTVSKENAQAEKDLSSAEADFVKIRSALEKNQEKVAFEEEQSQKYRSVAEDSTWEIKSKYYGGDRVLEFCLKGFVGKKSTLFDHLSSINLPVEKPSKTIEALKKESESLSGDGAQKYDSLSELSFSAGSVEKNELFGTVVLGNQDSAVSGLIKNLESGDWVKEGLEYLQILQAAGDESCPFCQKKTITNAVSDSLREYFDESYERALSELKSFRLEYVSAIQNLPELSAYQENPFIDSKLDELSARYSALLELLSANVSRIDAKIRNPSQIQLLSDSGEAFEEFNHIVRNANQSIASHNKKIDNKKQELEKIKAEFWGLMRWEYDSEIALFNRSNLASQKTLNILQENNISISNEIAVVKEKISAIQKTTVNVDSAIESINKKLVDLGIQSFKIVKHKDSLYRLERSEDGSGDFHSLSEGEKTVISFLYFLERCRGKSGVSDVPGRRIIVIDDPISSLSHVYIFNVGQMIKSEIFNSDKFEQVFVLTHSLYFFYELTDANHDRRKKWQNLFRIIKNSTGSRIQELGYSDIQNDYQAYWGVIKDDQQPAALIANCMRNIVEYFFGFVEKNELSNIFQKPSFQDNKFQAFYRFMNRESHSFGQNVFDYKEFDFNIFHEALRLLFHESGFPEHYAAMMK